MQDDKRKIEKYHATLKEKEARYQRMVSLASRKNDATEEKYPINKEEEESGCLTDVEMKRSYIGALRNAFTSRKTKREENCFEPEHISPHKRNKENGLDNGLAILDEIWSKQRSAHDRSGLGYK